MDERYTWIPVGELYNTKTLMQTWFRIIIIPVTQTLFSLSQLPSQLPARVSYVIFPLRCPAQRKLDTFVRHGFHDGGWLNIVFDKAECP